MSGSGVDLNELEKQFIAGKDDIKAQKNALRFAVTGDGTFLDVSFQIQGKSFSIGKATSIKKGAGQFLTQHVVVGLLGAYRLTIDAKAAKLSENSEQIWVWVVDTGRAPDAGILGDVDVVFDSKVVSTLARLLATLYE